MNYIPTAFKSPILAQKRLLGFDLNKIEDNTCKPTMPNISTVPSFNTSKAEPLRTDFGLPVAELVELFKRKAKSTYKKLLISARGREILSKALKYDIPFNKNDIDWDYSFYDPVGLEQEITSSQHDGYLERKELQTDFYATRSVEVEL